MCYSSQVVQGNTRELQTYGYMFDKTSFIYIEVHAVTSMSKTRGFTLLEVFAISTSFSIMEVVILMTDRTTFTTMEVYVVILMSDTISIIFMALFSL